MLEGGPDSQEDVLASATDYASAASVHLVQALTEDRQTQQRRQSVLDTLSGHRFQPVFQPVVDLRTAEVVGYEALTRLRSGQPIQDLLDQAEAADVRSDCEMAMLRAAVERSHRLPARAWLSMNLSPSVLIGKAAELSCLLDVGERQVVLELTENEPIEDYPAVRRAMERLGGRVKLSVDDTGSGYASLRHVIDLRPHYLKLDRNWIKSLEEDEIRQALIAGLVAFCQHTSTQLIAEGIERDVEKEILLSLGVEYGQGYLLGRPEPHEG